MADTYQAKLTVTGRDPNDNTLEIYRTAGTDCTELAATYRNQHFWLPTGNNWMTRKWISGEDQDDGFKQCVCVNAALPSVGTVTACGGRTLPDMYFVHFGNASISTNPLKATPDTPCVASCGDFPGGLNFVPWSSSGIFVFYVLDTGLCGHIDEIRVIVRCREDAPFYFQVDVNGPDSIVTEQRDVIYRKSYGTLEELMSEITTPGNEIVVSQFTESPDNQRDCDGWPAQVTVTVPEFS